MTVLRRRVTLRAHQPTPAARPRLRTPLPRPLQRPRPTLPVRQLIRRQTHRLARHLPILLVVLTAPAARPATRARKAVCRTAIAPTWAAAARRALLIKTVSLI